MAAGFKLRTYSVIGVDRFPVSPTEIKDGEDRDLAASMPGYFQAEIVSQLAKTKVFARVVDLSEVSLDLGRRKRCASRAVRRALRRLPQVARWRTEGTPSRGRDGRSADGGEGDDDPSLTDPCVLAHSRLGTLLLFRHRSRSPSNHGSFTLRS
jgi:hypothetical protein